jgi:hypothetical protein
MFAQQRLLANRLKSKITRWQQQFLLIVAQHQ